VQASEGDVRSFEGSSFDRSIGRQVGRRTRSVDRYTRRSVGRRVRTVGKRLPSRHVLPYSIGGRLVERKE
jgi:hypothetical protein